MNTNDDQTWQGDQQQPPPAPPEPTPPAPSEPPAPAAPEPAPPAPAAALQNEPPAPAAAVETIDEPVNVADLQRQIAELNARITAAQPTAVHTATSTTATQPLPTAELAEQVDVAHAVGPGSAGPAVRELAATLETLGEKTYLSRGENPDDVFHDDLMAAVKRVVTGYVRDHAEVNELEMKLRDVAMLNTVAGETWRILRHLVDQAAETTKAA